MVRLTVKKHILDWWPLLLFFPMALTASTDLEGRCERTLARLDLVNPEAMELAVRDLARSFPDAYPKAEVHLRQLEAMTRALPKLCQKLEDREAGALEEALRVLEFQREVLLANPLLDFDRVLVLNRRPLGEARRATGDPENDKGLGKYLGIPQQSSWQLHTMPNVTGWENEIDFFSLHDLDADPTTIYTPPHGELINEMDLHFDGRRLMFSMPDGREYWQVHELDLESRELRQVTASHPPDVHNLDSCYLPNDRIAYVSTAPFQGVPCNASVNVGMLYSMDPDGSHVRQLCFEQDHNFCPTVMNDGRILYLRWEYTDIPHVWARFLFTMNPDGTAQREFYGSGSYWPNAIFYARPIPGDSTRFVGIVTGHHVGRVGDLILFDPAQSRRENLGVVQRIPGRGKKVRPLIQDKLTLDHWPKFLHPYPLSGKYFLVAAKPRPDSLWGIYLVDVFDNMVLLKEAEGRALLEPLPWRATKRPPVIADRVDPSRKDALVYIENIYRGPGLRGVPEGAVKKLRLFTYHFAYRTIAGINHRVGADGPWEPKRVLGWVPVESDGSAFFRVPANTPISLQPVDENGQALQLMRSWMTAMPGEFVSCVGCHEKQNSAPPNLKTIASRSRPESIHSWHGPPRGFSFRREVQPVLDRYCIACHNGDEESPASASPDLRGDQGRFICYRNGNPEAVVETGKTREELVLRYGGVFDPAYIELRRRVRVGGLESDLRLLNPAEFRANTSELIQLLKKGHYGVDLDSEAWGRLYTWIDLNAPCHGTWTEVVGWEKLEDDSCRRRDLRALYGGVVEDPESYPVPPPAPPEQVPEPVPPPEFEAPLGPPRCPDWPVNPDQLRHRLAGYEANERVLDLGGGVMMEMMRVPAGRFVMGAADGFPDESPEAVVAIEKSFWIGKFEVSNRQFACFNRDHDSRYEHKGSWMFNEWDLGWDLNRPDQPVLRVSQREAVAFCRWLSEQIHEKVELPTEAQWEYACRAGTASPFSFGGLNEDFARYANMADASIRDYAYDVRDQYPPDLLLRDERFNDGALVSTEVGAYRPNALGLHDMHGNVAEWTRTAYRPYPYRGDDGRNASRLGDEMVVRGGSWYDRPVRCRSSFRLSYPSWQKVFNVGFRVVIEANEEPESLVPERRAPGLAAKGT